MDTGSDLSSNPDIIFANPAKEQAKAPEVVEKIVKEYVVKEFVLEEPFATMVEYIKKYSDEPISKQKLIDAYTAFKDVTGLSESSDITNVINGNYNIQKVVLNGTTYFYVVTISIVLMVVFLMLAGYHYIGWWVAVYYIIYLIAMIYIVSVAYRELSLDQITNINNSIIRDITMTQESVKEMIPYIPHGLMAMMVAISDK
jgi:hypothetical protein